VANKSENREIVSFKELLIEVIFEDYIA